MSNISQGIAALPNWKSWEALDADCQRKIKSSAPVAEVLGLVAPTMQEEMALTIAELHHSDYAVLPYGAGTKLDWGGLVGDARPVVAVSTANLNRLVDHAVADMTVTVEAGMKLSELQGILAEKEQFLTIDPRFVRTGATIGGVIATADSGSLRHRYGGVRDIVLGVSFVRSDGEPVKAGGRVVKNVAGYDLMKLMTGSYGTLGVMTQVTLRTYPFQPVSQTLVLTGAAQALVVMSQQLLSSVMTPLTMDWLSAQAMTALGLKSALGLVVRFESVQESVAAQSQRVREMAHELDVQAIVYPQVDEVEFWEGIGKIGEVGEVICKVGVRSSEVVRVLSEVAELVPEMQAIVHTASGLGRLVLPDVRAVKAVRDLCEKTGGFLSVLVAPVAAKQEMDIWGMRENVGELMQAVKREFDGANILSPGRFVG